MPLSSNTLTHFTKNLTSLKGILKDHFQIKYCRETIYSKNEKKDLLIPMVSFCDIPFSQVLGHIKKYGNYGIGLKKTWAESKGLNPVLYLEKESSLTKNIVFNTYKTIINEKEKMSELNDDDKYNLDYLRYLKNYQADLIRKDKVKQKNYRFSDEREWRYVLPVLNECQIFVNLAKGTSNDTVKQYKDFLNRKAGNERLTFTPEDINYIIIKTEAERDKIIQSLESVKGMYPLRDVKRLTSRIISTEQLKTDF